MSVSFPLNDKATCAAAPRSSAAWAEGGNRSVLSCGPGRSRRRPVSRPGFRRGCLSAARTVG